jgi:hypothetical protein
MLADLTGRLRSSIRNELLHNFCVRKYIANEESVGFCASDLFSDGDNVNSFVPPINPNGDDVEAFALREVSNEVRAHGLKWSHKYFV